MHLTDGRVATHMRMLRLSYATSHVKHIGKFLIWRFSAKSPNHIKNLAKVSRYTVYWYVEIPKAFKNV